LEIHWETNHAEAITCRARCRDHAAGATGPAAAGKAVLNLVLVLDGLRPDSITASETPNLWRLREEGVNFLNGHSVFPTVTRVNATPIGTGTYPDRNGMLGNTIYVRQVDPNHAFGNDDHRNLLRLDAAANGGMVLAKSLGEILAERGKTLAVVSSGTTGSALLVNPRAPKGVGVLVNGYWEPGARVAFPDTANNTILHRFPAAPAKGGTQDPSIESVTWTQRVLRDYVLGELKPDVVVNWLTEPDHIQHGIAAGSPAARAAIRNDDREIGLLIDRLRELGLAERTNIIVVSDHGFGHGIFGVNVTEELRKAGLKAGPDSDDVVVASTCSCMCATTIRNVSARSFPSCRSRHGWACCSPPASRAAPACRWRAASPAPSRSSWCTSRVPSAAPTS
jgi:hypothetical protein